jgi:hypothetical protein
MWNCPRAKGAGVFLLVESGLCQQRQLQHVPEHLSTTARPRHAMTICNGTWQRVSHPTDIPRAWPRCLKLCQDCHVHAAVYFNADMPFSRPDYCIAERTIEKEGEVELWTLWSFQTSPYAPLEFLLTILDSMQMAAACHWTTREPQRSRRVPAEEPHALHVVSLRLHSHRTVVQDDTQDPISPSTHVHWLDRVLHGEVSHLTTSVDHLEGQLLKSHSVNGVRYYSCLVNTLNYFPLLPRQSCLRSLPIPFIILSP